MRWAAPVRDGLLVYLPTQAPVSDQAQQANPCAAALACRAVLPDGAGDEYAQRCL